MKEIDQPQDQHTIALRGMSTETYLDELPFTWRNFQVEHAERRINKKGFRIINRRHLVNSYPEE